MTSTALLLVEDFRDTQQRRDHFDHWLNQLEDRMRDQTPTLEELTQAVFALSQELTQAVTEGLVERTAACPRCGQMWSASGSQERPVETWVRAIRLRRLYFYCEHCRLGNDPLDAALELAERRKHPDVQKAAVALTKKIPYETARELFEPLTGLPLSVHTAHEVTHAVATGLTVVGVTPTQEAIVAKIAAIAAGQIWRPILVLTIDGAEVPTRPETAKGWRPGRKQSRA